VDAYLIFIGAYLMMLPPYMIKKGILTRPSVMVCFEEENVVMRSLSG
jgi:hypothetical protein